MGEGHRVGRDVHDGTAREIGLERLRFELGETLQRLLFERLGVASDVGLPRSFDVWHTALEGSDQLTELPDLLFRFVVLLCIGHSVIALGRSFVTNRPSLYGTLIFVCLA
jgi:hypothetical protein